MRDEDDDGRFPDQSPVEVRCPRPKQEELSDREGWPWLPGTIVEQCGPDECSVHTPKAAGPSPQPSRQNLMAASTRVSGLSFICTYDHVQRQRSWRGSGYHGAWLTRLA